MNSIFTLILLMLSEVVIISVVYWIDSIKDSVVVVDAIDKVDIGCTIVVLMY